MYGTLSSKPRQRKLSPKKASELTFTMPKQEKPDIQSTNLTQDEPVQCFNEDSFRQILEQSQPSTGWLLNFAEEKDIEQPVRKHIDIDHCCHDAVKLSAMTQCFEIERTISEEDVKYLERMTVGQAKNVIWVEERLTRLTASKFGDVFCLKKSVFNQPRSISEKNYVQSSQ